MRNIKLTPKRVTTLPDGWYTDGTGLYLVVQDNGTSRFWKYMRTKEGRRFNVNLGSIDHLPLEAARKLVKQINDALTEGILPKAYLQSLQPQKEEKKPSLNDVFEKAMRDIAKHKRWRHPGSELQWRGTMQRYVLPIIGDIPLNKITHKEVLKVVQPIWETMHVTAVLLLNRLEVFLNWSELHGYRTGENPAKWNSKISAVLSRRFRGEERKPHKAISIDEMPMLCEKLWRSNKLGHKAVLFGILTATRVTEFREAKWEEFDFENRVWNIPPARRKDRKPFPHRVPLSNETMALLEQLSNKTDRLFPGMKNTFIHHRTPYEALQTIGYKVSMLGMRSTFRDWTAITRQDLYASEVALSHSFGTQTTRSYLRTDMLDERREIMQKWADYCFKNIDSLEE